MLFALGLGIFGWGAYCAIRSHRASAWPSALGTVNTCEIKKSTDVDGITYRVHIGYSYEVHGRQYHGERIAFGYSGSNRYAEHAALYEKLSRSQNLNVRYNRSNPADSVLACGPNLSTIRILVFGFIWLLFMTGFSALWSLSVGTAAWNTVFQLTLFFFTIGCIGLWRLSRKIDKGILDRIEIL